MGYNITIGNAKPHHDTEDGILSASWRVEDVKNDAAPAFGEPTDFTNSRWPSYTAWADTCRALGLHDLFFKEYEGLMAEHPGCKLLLPEHLVQIEGALNVRKAKNGGKAAGFEDGQDYDLARGEWLLYWVKWALDNCETPAIENT